MPDSLVITYSKALGRSSKIWTPTEMAIRDFFKMIDRPMPGEKGSVGCFTPARFKENIRSKLTAIEINTIVLDLDIHCPKKQIIDRLKSLGALVHLSSTASHGLTVTEVGVIEFDGYKAGRIMGGFSGSDTTLAADWLIHKGHHPSLIPVTGVRIQPFTKRTSEDRKDGTTRIVVEHKIKIFHNPIHKFRILIPLAVPWRASDYAGPAEAAEAWAELYLRTIDRVDLPCDEVCRTPDRLIYFTAIPDEEAERRALACHCTIDGPLFEPRALPPARVRPPAPPKIKHGVMGTELREENGRLRYEPTHAEWVDPDNHENKIDLLDWYHRGPGRRYRVTDALRDRGVAVPDNRDDGYDGQVHWLCPYEGEHSPTNGGFFTKNARANDELPDRAYGSEKGWVEFVCTCGHATCDGRHKLDFILKFLDLGMLTIADLWNEEYMVTAGIYDEFGEIIDEAAEGSKGGVADALAELDAQAGEPVGVAKPKKKQRSFAQLFIEGSDDLRDALTKRASDPDKKAKIDKAWEGLRGEGSVAWLDAAAETETGTGNGVDWLCDCLTKLLRDKPTRIGNAELADALYALSEDHGEKYLDIKGQLTNRDFGRPVIVKKTWEDIVEKRAKSAAKAAEADRAKSNAPQADAGSKPIIMCLGGHISEAVDKIDQVISSLDPPMVFYRDGLVRVVDNPVAVILEDGVTIAAGSKTIKDMKDADARVIVAQHAVCVREGAKGAVIPIDPPSDYMTAWRERGNSSVPYLRAISPVPILRYDGGLSILPGYDAESLLYFSGGVEVDVPKAPTYSDAQAALDVLLSPFVGFPLESRDKPREEDIDTAALLSALFTLAIRPLLRTSPIHVISARASRTGKGLLVKAICTLVSGADAMTLPATKSKDENLVSEEHRKRITTVLKAAPCAAHFDNETGSFGSDPLCTMLTSEEWADRELGTSNSVRLPNTVLTFVSGNNLSLRGDMVGRAVALHMDADVERPEARKFEITDLIGYIVRERPVLLSALFTILRAYRHLGRPGGREVPLGAFEMWSLEVAGCVRWLGFPNPADSQFSLAQTDEVRSTIATIFYNWRMLVGDTPIGATQFLKEIEDGKNCIARDNDPQGEEERNATLNARKAAALMLDEVLCRELHTKTPRPNSLGKYLKGIEGTISDGRKLVIEVNKHTKTSNYLLRQT